MGLKRTRSQTLQVQVKRQNIVHETGLLSPPLTPLKNRSYPSNGSSSSVRKSSRPRSALTKKLISFQLNTPPSSSSSSRYSSSISSDDDEADNDEANGEILELSEKQFIDANKENLSPEDEIELRLVQEAELKDARFDVKTPQVEEHKVSIYSNAKKLFSKNVDILNSDPISSFTSVTKANYCLVGREREFDIIEKFLVDNLTTNKSDFLYISGPPGCGKTQQITHVLNYIVANYSATVSGNKKLSSQVHKLSLDDTTKASKTVTITKINCMRLNSLGLIFEEFLSNFGINSRNINTYPKYLKLKTTIPARELFNRLLTQRAFADNNVVLLDELDAILNTSKSNADQQLLFDFFSLAKQNVEDSRLVLVGIANSLNLIDRLSPRLKLNGLKTSMVQFLPYNTQQIVAIVKAKLSSLNANSNTNNKNNNDLPIISPSALQLCAKKTASNTGDLRKVFEILYKSIELVETATKKQYLANPEKSIQDFHALDISKAPKVSLTHVAKICANSLNGVSSLNRLKQVNLHQCLVLICLAKLEQQKNEEMMINNSSSGNKKNVLKDAALGALNTHDNDICSANNNNNSSSSIFMKASTGPQSSSIFNRHNKSTNNNNNSINTNNGKAIINITQLFQYYKKISKSNTMIPSSLSKTEITEILTTLHTIGLINILNRANHMNINSQTSLSCCGIGLVDLNKFTDGKFEILKSALKA